MPGTPAVGARPTMQTVASAAGVSRMTVSNAYNRPDQIAASTRERVLAIARELGYPGPDPAAQSLRRRTTGVIAVVLTARLPEAFTDPGLVTILHGMAAELSQAGRGLLLLPTTVHAAQGPSPVQTAIADALVLIDLAEDDPSVIDALERRIPLVTISHPRLPGVPRVAMDNELGAALAAGHLLSLGHRRLAVLDFRHGQAGEDGPGAIGSVTAPARPGVAARPLGFARAVAGAGLEPGHVEVVSAATNTRRGGREALAPVLRRPAGQRPTAVFAVTDILALGALDAAAAAGVPVPGELSVAGFDDIDAAAAAAPPLTTVSQSLLRQGQLAARIALRRIAGQPARSPRLTPELIIRASTGPAPS